MQGDTCGARRGRGHRRREGGRTASALGFRGPFIPRGTHLVQSFGHVAVAEVETGQRGQVFLGGVGVVEPRRQHARPVQGPLPQFHFPVRQRLDGRLVVLHRQL
ncbi:MAG: hypothetical protein ACK55I_14770, partial [bacterium]